MPTPLVTGRQFLLRHDFAGYEKWIGEEQQRYERERSAPELADRLEAAQSQTRSIDLATSAWLDASPTSYAALLARATYLMARGDAARGISTSDRVSSRGWRLMRGSHRDAAGLFVRAAQRVRVPSHAYAQIGRMAWIGGQAVASELDWYHEGLARDPGSLELRRSRLNALRPEWGGSVEQFIAYRDDAQHQAMSATDRMEFRAYAACVLGFYRVAFEGDAEAGLRQIDEAIAAQPTRAWNHYWGGMARHMAGDLAGSLEAYSLALALAPDELELLWSETGVRWTIDRDDPRVASQLQRAMELGKAEAFADLGRYRYWVLADKPGAIDVWRKGSEEGIGLCSYRLAERHDDGADGALDIDPQRALALYRKALDQGHGAAGADIYNLVRSGKCSGMTREDAAHALLEGAHVFDNGYAHAVVVEAIRDDGLRYDTIGSDDAGSDDDRSAHIGAVRFSSDPMQPGDPAVDDYLHHVHAAIAAGNAWAHVEQARVCFDGVFVPASPENGAYWLEKVIEEQPEATSSTTARRLLALRMLDGSTAGEREHAQALLEHAAQAGDHEALRAIVDWHARGVKRFGVKADPRQARAWAERAVAAGALPSVDAGDRHESVSRNVLLHLVFGPVALTWSFAVLLFGKRRLKRVLLWTFASVFVGFVALVVAVMLDPKRADEARRHATVSSETGGEAKPTLAERIRQRAEDRRKARAEAAQAADKKNPGAKGE